MAFRKSSQKFSQQSNRNIAIAAAFIFAIASFCPPAFAQTFAKLVSIEKATNDALRAEIQMMELSTRFHAAWVKPSRCKSWRVFAYKMTDSAATNAGMITIAASRFQYANNPSAAPRPYLKAGHIVNLAAASVLVGGTLTESFIDHIGEMQIARKHLDPKSSLKNFLALRENLDSLLASRTALVNSCDEFTPRQKEILEVDGLVLQDLRELVSIEFRHVYSEVARLRGLRNLANATTLISAGTAGYMGSLNSLLSVANRQPKQLGVAGLGFITSGSTVAASPLINTFGSQYIASRANKKLESYGVGRTGDLLDRFDQHRDRLEQLLASSDPAEVELLTALDARRSVYQLHNAILDDRSETRFNEKRALKSNLKERLFFSTIVGGTNIARGTQLAVAGFKYYDEPETIFKLAASASTAFIVGTGVWNVDNIQGKIREEKLYKKLKAAKTSVHAKLLLDLESLQQMEDQMRVF